MVSPDLAPELVVDAIGLLCPLPILRTASAMKRVPAGRLLALLADDEGVLEDLPAWCEGNGHELLAIEQQQATAGSPGAKSGFYCLVRKKSELSLS